MGLSAAAPWLRQYGNTPETLSYPSASMYQLVRRTAEQHPNKTAYVFMGKRTGYAQFLERIENTAKGLYAIGIRKADRVTICMPNMPQAVDCFYALNRIGAVPNMIHPLSASPEIAFYLNASGSKAILTLDQFYDKVVEADPKCKIILARIEEELPVPLRLVYPLTQKRKKRPKDCVFWKDMLSRGEKVVLPEETGTADDCAAILYSGGTTGKTKGILLSNRNFNALGLQTIAASGFSSVAGMKMLSIMPMFHGFGLGIGIHTALIGGATCILVPRFSVKIYADILKKQNPELIPGVPTLFEALLRAEQLQNQDLSFLKGIFAGGDCLSPELKKRVDRFLADHGCTEQIREGYGTTECVTASCLTPRHTMKEGSIGVPFPDMYYKIVKTGTTEECEPGEEGEICISGPTVMLGYMDEPEETKKVLQTHEDGRLWLHTGDLGFMDEDGFVYFRQRLKRLIVTSGYNVYPSVLENILDGHEKVQLSCVIGVADAYRGQRVRAYIVPKPGIQPTEELKRELLEFCAGQVAKYAAPRELEFRAELPKTPVGKVAYRVLELEAEKENTL